MTDPPITRWIHGARDGHEESERALWNHFFQRVVRLARSRMFALQGTIYDEEDAAISALNSLFRGIRGDRFPDLRDRHNLWRILVLITNRKLRAQWRRETTQKRSSSAAEFESPSIEDVICDEPTPEYVLELMDELDGLIERLDDPTLRRIAVMRMDGFSNDEIAMHFGCTSRTVRRKLERIRDIWDVADDD